MGGSANPPFALIVTRQRRGAESIAAVNISTSPTNSLLIRLRARGFNERRPLVLRSNASGEEVEGNDLLVALPETIQHGAGADVVLHDEELLDRPDPAAQICGRGPAQPGHQEEHGGSGSSRTGTDGATLAVALFEAGGAGGAAFASSELLRRVSVACAGRSADGSAFVSNSLAEPCKSLIANLLTVAC